ncbi:MAG: hypothetical protein ABH858_00695 [Candidatus Omnitrophota bacterium]
MELLIIILNQTQYLDKILSILVEAGVSGATISESEGIGHYLAYEVPIFAGLRKFIGEAKSNNKTIMAVLEEKGISDQVVRLFEEEGIDFSQPGLGVIITVPANKVIKNPRG